ncbi:NFACT RNA binding domain-containing protein [Larkinella soli]|uniref:NFACT RNA binding domain-containing protein n=1 Tax=Larkinella soli TaxID=1770527 RepID=UPI000FFC9C33|nr:NFACT RNA binding domain-containing protein [Larkinella soli]
MHTNYYFLRRLAPALAPNLMGLKLMECFSQDRDELVLVFAQAKGKINFYRPFYIKATLRPDFSGLFFPETVQRARTNSVDLFEELYDREVTGARSFLNERCLGITLEGGFTVVFKFFGNRPNLLVFSEDEVTDVFNNKLVGDNNLRLSGLDRPLDQSREAFERSSFDHRRLFPTFGKEVNAWLDGRFTDAFGAEEPDGMRKWEIIQDTLRLLDEPRYYLTTFQHKPTLALIPVGEVRQEFTEPLEASNRFFSAFMGQNTLDREKGDALRLLEKRLKRTRAYIETNLQRLIDFDTEVRNEEIANILMANLHRIPERAESVELEDFYRNKPIRIKLKTDLSPQKNAEGYYRKAKNEKIETTILQEQLDARERELEQLSKQTEEIRAIESLRELRKYLKAHPVKDEKVAQSDSAPLFKQVTHEGFVILVGRNAKNNDLLTQQYAYKDDLWLHARDVAGSHVIIKYQAGKKFPKPVIERAAELAAWYSKRRTDTLCPVIVTPKKFVRKPKGLAEGQVVVEKEEVVMVVPRGE